jgi:hypothetical protein
MDELKKTEADWPMFYDAASDEMRRVTQADLDDMRDARMCVYLKQQIDDALRQPGMPMAERLRYLKRVLDVVNNDGYGPVY